MALTGAGLVGRVPVVLEGVLLAAWAWELPALRALVFAAPVLAALILAAPVLGTPVLVAPVLVALVLAGVVFVGPDLDVSFFAAVVLAAAALDAAL
jgi:hypothetical protein